LGCCGDNGITTALDRASKIQQIVRLRGAVSNLLEFNPL